MLDTGVDMNLLYDAALRQARLSSDSALFKPDAAQCTDKQLN